MKLSIKKILKWSLKIIGPVLFVFFLLKLVDPHAVLARLKEIDIRILLLSFLISPLIVLIPAFRWWIIFRQLKVTVPFRRLFNTSYISWFLSLIPVGGVFPVAKLVYLKEYGLSIRKISISMVIDKIFDVLGLFVFALFAVIYFPNIFFDTTITYWLLGMTALLIVIFINGKRIVQIISRKFMGNKLQQISGSIESDLDEFWSNFTLKSVFIYFALAVAIGLMRSLTLYLLALSIHIHVSFLMIIACRSLIGIVHIIPISFNGLGTRDAILLLALPLSAVSNDAALSLGFLAFLWAIIFKFSGLIFWLYQPLPTRIFKEVKDKLSI